jgi:hypothetical protein
MKVPTAVLIFCAAFVFFAGAFYFADGTSFTHLLNLANQWIGLVPVYLSDPFSTACFGAAEDFCGPGAGLKNLLLNGLVDAAIVTVLVSASMKLKSKLKRVNHEIHPRIR